MDSIKIFAERLRTLRAKTPQEALAKELGVSRGSISFYENGDRTPDADFIVKASRYFGVTADYLLGLSDYKTVEKQDMALRIPLSDPALDFLKECTEEHLRLVAALLSAPHFVMFLETFQRYIETSLISPDEIPDPVMPLLDHINRKMTEEEFVKFLERWKWDTVCQSLEVVCQDLKEHWVSIPVTDNTEVVPFIDVLGGDESGNGQKARE